MGSKGDNCSGPPSFTPTEGVAGVWIDDGRNVVDTR
jgi:hypothetical protein